MARRVVISVLTMVLSGSMLASCTGDPSASAAKSSGVEGKTEVPAAGPGSLDGRATLFGESDHSGIVISASGWQESTSAQTDTAGAFTLNGMAEGYNVLTFHKEGYTRVTQGVVISPEGSTSINDVTLFPLGSISGRVMRLDGKPVRDALVLACQSNPHAGGAIKDLTSAGGRYQFRHLNPGFYQITAFIEDEVLAGFGRGGGFGVTVLINPGMRFEAEVMTLRRYGRSSRGLIQTGC